MSSGTYTGSILDGTNNDCSEFIGTVEGLSVFGGTDEGLISVDIKVDSVSGG